MAFAFLVNEESKRDRADLSLIQYANVINL